MSQQIINVGPQPNDGKGDPIRTAFIKTNNNFTELYARFQTSVPVTLIGKPGDVPGMYASDALYFYYCFAIYNGINDIWSRVSNGNVAIPSQIVNGNSAVNIPVSGGNVQVSVGGIGQIANFYTGGLSVVGTVSAGSLVANSLTANNYTVSNLTVLSNIVTGNANVAGNINASYFFGNGSLLTGLPETYSNANVAAYLPVNTSNVSAGNVNVTGNVTTLGTLASQNIITGRITANGNIIGSQIFGNFSGIFQSPGNTGQLLFNNAGVIAGSPNLALSGSNLAVAGGVTASQFSGDGSRLSNISYANISGIGNVSSISLNGNGSQFLSGNGSWQTVTANGGGNGTVTNVGGSGNALGFSLSGNVTSSGNLTLSGPSAANLRSTLSIGTVANIDLSGNSSQVLSGNGSWQAFSSESYGNANVAAYLPTYSGNISANNVTTSGNINGNLYGTTTGTHIGLVYDIDIRYMVWDFGFVPANTFNNPIQYLLAKTGNIDMGTITAPANLNIDTGYF